MKNSFIIISYLENTSKNENHSHQRLAPSIKNKECPHCGSPERRTGAGRKPKEASLHCRECKRFLRWISANELKALIKGGKHGK